MCKLIQEVRCSRCKRGSEVDVSKSKDPFQPIGPNWTCGKPDCEMFARLPHPCSGPPGIFHDAKPPKYHNEPTVLGGIKFASKKEANRYAELKMMEKAGEISMLRRQVSYELIPKQEGERACHFIADFVYNRGEVVVCEDTKGTRTPAYVMKRKLMLFRHGIRVVES